MDTPIIATVTLAAPGSQPRGDGDPSGIRDEIVELMAHVTRMCEMHRDVARHLGVELEDPSEEDKERYGWRDGIDFLFRPASVDADLVQVTRMIFNWRLQVLRPDMLGRYEIVAHWCFNDPSVLLSFVKTVRALAGWRGDVHSEPAGYVKKLDGRPETPAGRRAR
jgi:hypothetical protein